MGSVPSLFAAGDVCAYPALKTGTRVRIEHWEVATQQGQLAAKNMLGKHIPFTTIPFFWSGLFGKDLRFVGHAPEILDRLLLEAQHPLSTVDDCKGQSVSLSLSLSSL